MTPPEADVAGETPDAAPEPPAVSPCLGILRQRADFLKAAGARRQAMPAFILQARRRNPAEGEPGAIRVGFTCSRRVGNAVARNRAKRRLRALAREILPVAGRSGWDYVLIGRRDTTASHPFARMRQDLLKALEKVHT